MAVRQATMILGAAVLALLGAIGVLTVGPKEAEAASTRALVCKVY